MRCDVSKGSTEQNGGKTGMEKQSICLEIQVQYTVLNETRRMHNGSACCPLINRRAPRARELLQDEKVQDRVSCVSLQPEKPANHHFAYIPSHRPSAMLVCFPRGPTTLTHWEAMRFDGVGH